MSEKKDVFFSDLLSALYEFKNLTGKVDIETDDHNRMRKRRDNVIGFSLPEIMPASE